MRACDVFFFLENREYVLILPNANLAIIHEISPLFNKEISQRMLETDERAKIKVHGSFPFFFLHRLEGVGLSFKILMR